MQGRPADITRLTAIMARLRAPDGCPWDREQTHESLRPYLVEEAYEVLEAIDGARPAQLCEELGDLLLQIVFHAQLAHEVGAFDMQDVIDAISDKMTRRHPHVFGDEAIATADGVRDRWEQLKVAEGRTLFGGTPKSLPGLLRAQRVSEKAAGVGFDWRSPSQVLAKVHEEVGELEAEMTGPGRARIEEELGDLLFALTSFARHSGVIAEDAVHRATNRFERRFAETQRLAQEAGRALQDCDDDELELYWQEAKRRLKHLESGEPSGSAR